MIEKREAARRERPGARAAAVHAAAPERDAAEEARAASDRDVLAALRTLGYRANEARDAAAFSATLADAPLEKRVRLALSYFRPKARSHSPAVASVGAAP